MQGMWSACHSDYNSTALCPLEAVYSSYVLCGLLAVICSLFYCFLLHRAINHSALPPRVRPCGAIIWYVAELWESLEHLAMKTGVYCEEKTARLVCCQDACYWYTMPVVISMRPWLCWLDATRGSKSLLTCRLSMHNSCVNSQHNSIIECKSQYPV